TTSLSPPCSPRSPRARPSSTNPPPAPPSLRSRQNEHPRDSLNPKPRPQPPAGLPHIRTRSQPMTAARSCRVTGNTLWRPGPLGAGEYGAAAGPAATCDDQVSGGRLRRAVPQRAGGADAGRFCGCGVPGREMAWNAAVARLALATGLRRREFTFLLVFEVPPAPPAAHPPGLPVLFPVPAALAKGGKHRTTWIDADTLHAVHGYITLDRAASAACSVWSPPVRAGE